MGLLSMVGKLAWGATKLTTKVAAGTVGLAYIGTKATAKVIYDHREDIASAAVTTAKVATKVTVATTVVACKVSARTVKAIAENPKSALIVGGAALVCAPAVGAALSVAGLGVAGGTLSGAAASSAGLAALGGGSLATGGLGMLGGSAVVTAAGAITGAAVSQTVMPDKHG